MSAYLRKKVDAKRRPTHAKGVKKEPYEFPAIVKMDTPSAAVDQLAPTVIRLEALKPIIG